MGERIYAECCRCRNRHLASDRVPGRMNKSGGTPQVCPRCKAKSYFVVFEADDQADTRTAGDGDKP